MSIYKFQPRYGIGSLGFGEIRPDAPTSESSQLLPVIADGVKPRQMNPKDFELLRRDRTSFGELTHFGNVAPLDGLFGRSHHRIINEIIERLNGGGSLDIVGLRRAGKTSIMQGAVQFMTYYLQKDLSEHRPSQLPIFMSMQEFMGSGRLIESFGNALKKRVEIYFKKYGITKPRIDNEIEISPLVRRLAEYGLSVALFLDELIVDDDVDAQATHLFGQMRSLQQERDNGFVLTVSTGARHVFEKAIVQGSSLGNILYPIDVPLFNPDDTYEMVSILLSKALGESVAPSKNFVDLLHRTSGGYPYIIKGLLSTINERGSFGLLGNDNPAEILQGLFPDSSLFHERLYGVFDSWMHGLNDAEILLLKRVICEGRKGFEDICEGSSISLHDAEMALNRYVKAGLIHHDENGKFSPRNLLFANWLLKKNASSPSDFQSRWSEIIPEAVAARVIVQESKAGKMTPESALLSAMGHCAVDVWYRSSDSKRVGELVRGNLKRIRPDAHVVEIDCTGFNSDKDFLDALSQAFTQITGKEFPKNYPLYDIQTIYNRTGMKDRKVVLIIEHMDRANHGFYSSHIDAQLRANLADPISRSFSGVFLFEEREGESLRPFSELWPFGYSSPLGNIFQSVNFR